jgi:hypothetical protein
MLPCETALQGLVKIIMKRTHLALPRERMLSKQRLKKTKVAGTKAGPDQAGSKAL